MTKLLNQETAREEDEAMMMYYRYLVSGDHFHDNKEEGKK